MRSGMRERGEGEWEEKGGEFEQFLLVLFFFLTPLSFFEYLQKKKKKIYVSATLLQIFNFFFKSFLVTFQLEQNLKAGLLFALPHSLPHSPLFFLIICSLFMLMEFDGLLTLMFHFSVSI